MRIVSLALAVIGLFALIWSLTTLTLGDGSLAALAFSIMGAIFIGSGVIGLALHEYRK